MNHPAKQPPQIPDKLYFKIGEVCELTGVKQHVLRYWESEFRNLAPQRAHSRQRLYRRCDVESILRIKRLLKEEGFTISGAKKLLARERRRGTTGVRTAETTAEQPPHSTAEQPPHSTVEQPPPSLIAPRPEPQPAAPPLATAASPASPASPASAALVSTIKEELIGIKEELLDLRKILER